MSDSTRETSLGLVRMRHGRSDRAVGLLEGSGRTLNTSTPPGQREIDHFPRFGLIPFATRFPTVVGATTIRIGGEVKNAVEVSRELQDLPRVKQRSDFHCVTTPLIRPTAAYFERTMQEHLNRANRHGAQD